MTGRETREQRLKAICPRTHSKSTAAQKPEWAYPISAPQGDPFGAHPENTEGHLTQPRGQERAGGRPLPAALTWCCSCPTPPRTGGGSALPLLPLRPLQLSPFLHGWCHQALERVGVGGGASLLCSFSGLWRATKRPDSGWGDMSSDPGSAHSRHMALCTPGASTPLSLKCLAPAAQLVRSGCSVTFWQKQQLSGPPCEQPARHSHSPVRPELRMSPAALPSYQGGQACWVWTPEEQSCDPLARMGLGARGSGCPCFLSPLAPFLPTALRVCFGR